MKRQTNTKSSLGDLIVALFDEANVVVSQPLEQRVMVCAALKHLLGNQVHNPHRIVLQAYPSVPNAIGGLK